MALATIVRILQPFALMTKKESSEASSKSLFLSCMRLSYFLKLTAVPILAFRGSSVYNALLAYLGVQIKGRAIVMDQGLYEYQYLTIEDKTIIDSSHITGHHVIFHQVTLGPSYIRGIVNQGTYCPCANITGPETDPWRAYIGVQTTRVSENPNISNGSATIIREKSLSLEDKKLSNSSDIENQIVAEDSDGALEVNSDSDGISSTSGHDDCISYSSLDISISF